MASVTEILRRLLTRVALLILTVGIGVGTGAWYAASQTPTYTAQAFVVVVPRPGVDAVIGLKYAQAYGRIATQGPVLAEAVAAMRHSASVDQVRRHVRTSTSPDVPLIEITGSADAPKEAADLANRVAGALVKFGNGSKTRSTVRLASFIEATPPADPSSPNTPLIITVGAAAGLLIGGLLLLAGVGGRTSVERREDPPAAEERAEERRAIHDTQPFRLPSADDLPAQGTRDRPNENSRGKGGVPAHGQQP
jgi:capsular polysaccharide biosynthesis protein